MVGIDRDSSQYPPGLAHCLGKDAPLRVSVLGNTALLTLPALAVFCSVKAPGSVILQAHDLAQHLKQAEIPLISGFHSPVEREILRVLLRGQPPLVICPARSLEKMRVRAEVKPALDEGRLAFVSPFSGNQRRATADLAWYRNRFAAALASAVLVAFAYPGSKTEQLCREIITWDKPLYTLDNAANEPLVALGAQALNPERLSQELGHFAE